jgi:ATP-dependent Clp protease ATP-binding subunit ClpC
MWTRFTDRAKKSLFFAQEEAQRNESKLVDTEHVLIGILLDQDSTAAAMVRSLGLDPNSVVDETRNRAQAITYERRADYGMSDGSKRVIDIANLESTKLGDEHLGTEHLLLGEIIEDAGLGHAILISFGATPEKLREALLRVRS